MSSQKPTYKQIMLQQASKQASKQSPPPPSSGSSPAPTYGPKYPLPPKPAPSGFSHREALYPYNKLVYFKDSVYDGLVMTSGILLTTFLIRQIKKDMAPQLTIKNAVSLATVTILSDYLIDYGKRYEYIPYKIM